MTSPAGPHFRGLTWEHPRGTHALRAAASEATPLGVPVSLQWDAQPLEGFESAPIGELADRYDLLVIDHPHLGDAITQGALQPLDEVFPQLVLDDLAKHSVGPSFASYSAEGHQWALPLDAATQVQAVRDELVGAAPCTWDEVLTLSREAPVALSLAGPHAFLSLCSLVVAIGPEPRSLPPRPAAADLIGEDSGPLFNREAAMAALATLHELAVRAPAGTAGLNPIGLLDRMRDRRDIACVPLIYGYVNYAASELAGAQIRFVDAPAQAPGGRPGSVIGGTGIAVSARATLTPALVRHLSWLLSGEAQQRFIPLHEGQPSRDSAWESVAVNDSFGNFYQGTRRTLELSWVRPRFAGYSAFQTEASAIVHEGLAAPHVSPGRIIDQLESAYRGALARAADAISSTTGVAR